MQECQGGNEETRRWGKHFYVFWQLSAVLLFSRVVLRNYKKIACDCSLKRSAEKSDYRQESSQKCPKQITATSHTLPKSFTWISRGFLSPGVCKLTCSTAINMLSTWYSVTLLVVFPCETQWSGVTPVANIQCLPVDLWYFLLRPVVIDTFIRSLLAWLTYFSIVSAHF